MLGSGVCDVPAVLTSVAEAPLFNGWVVVEEESATAAANPAAAIAANRKTLAAMLGQA
jgi:inosose dehydratase